jgi:hypothetical protein
LALKIILKKKHFSFWFGPSRRPDLHPLRPNRWPARAHLGMATAGHGLHGRHRRHWGLGVRTTDSLGPRAYKGAEPEARALTRRRRRPCLAPSRRTKLEAEPAYTAAGVDFEFLLSPFIPAAIEHLLDFSSPSSLRFAFQPDLKPPVRRRFGLAGPPSTLLFGSTRGRG